VPEASAVPEALDAERVPAWEPGSAVLLVQAWDVGPAWERVAVHR
jgi:hypothetical protein